MRSAAAEALTLGGFIEQEARQMTGYIIVRSGWEHEPWPQS